MVTTFAQHFMHGLTCALCLQKKHEVDMDTSKSDNEEENAGKWLAYTGALAIVVCLMCMSCSMVVGERNIPAAVGGTNASGVQM